MTAPLAALGRGVTSIVAQVGAMVRFFVDAVVAWWWLPAPGRRVAMSVLRRQIWFTAIQAIPLVIVLSGILSFLVISQAARELENLSTTPLIGRLMVVVIVRELGPLLTAVAVAGRSGSALAAELATNKVLGEVRALEGMGIDPVHYLVLPRLGGAIISLAGLIVVFDVVAILAGFVAATGRELSSALYFEIVLSNLTFRDAWLTPVKAVLFGAIVGTVPCFHGLRIAPAATQIPVAASRAVVASILAIFVSSGLFVALV